MENIRREKVSNSKKLKKSELISNEYAELLGRFYKKINNRNWSSSIKGNPTKSMLTYSFRTFLKCSPKKYLDYGCGTSGGRVSIIGRANEYYNNQDDDPALKSQKMNSWIEDVSVTNYDPAISKFSAVPTGKFDFIAVTNVLEFVEKLKLKTVLSHIQDLSDGKVSFLITTLDGKKKPPNTLSPKNMIKHPEYITLMRPKEWIRLMQDDWVVEHVETKGWLTAIVASPRIEKRKMELPKKDTHFPRNTDRYQYDVFARSLRYVKEVGKNADNSLNRRTAIDVGAHVGFYARALDEAFERVICFEPSSENYKCLVKNAPSAISYNMALGPENGIISLKIYDDNSGNNFSVAEDLAPDYKRVENVIMTTIDSFNFSNVDFIKIDVQGFELGVLKGAEKTIDKCRPAILVELEMPFTKEKNAEATRFLEEGLNYVEAERLGKDSIYIPFEKLESGEITCNEGVRKSLDLSRKVRGSIIKYDYSLKNIIASKEPKEGLIRIEKELVEEEFTNLLKKQLREKNPNAFSNITCYYMNGKLFSKYIMSKFCTHSSARLIDVSTVSEPKDGISVAMGIGCIEPIVKNCLRDKKELLYIDHAYFDRGYRAKGRLYEKPPNFRFVLNGLHPSRMIDRPSDRLNMLGVRLSNWRVNGGHILFCPPTDYFWKIMGLDGEAWLNDTIKTIRENTDRKIVIRTKPANDMETLFSKNSILFNGSKNGMPRICKEYKNIDMCISLKKRPIPTVASLVDCWAVVAPASSVSLEAAMLGIPSICEKYGPIAPISSHDYSEIESPTLGDREALLKHLSYCQFNSSEIERGKAWRVMQRVIESGLYKYE